MGKKCRKRCSNRIPPSALGHMGKVLIFEFFQNYTPFGGDNPKKYFEDTHRYQGVLHAKFGWNPSICLGSKSKQTNRQTPLLYLCFLLYIYIYIYASYERYWVMKITLGRIYQLSITFWTMMATGLLAMSLLLESSAAGIDASQHNHIPANVMGPLLEHRCTIVLLDLPPQFIKESIQLLLCTHASSNLLKIVGLP